MSVQDAIGSVGIKTGDYTVTRTAASTVLQGRQVAGAPSTFSIAASVQPYNGTVLRVLPEGIHTEDVRHVYTTTELRARPRPDKIAIGSSTFAVFAVEGPWDAFGGTHYIAHVARQELP